VEFLFNVEPACLAPLPPQFYVGNPQEIISVPDVPMHEDLPHRIQMSDPPTEPTRILSRDRYHSILSRLREVPVLSVPHFRNLSKQYSIHESTVSSIYYNDWSTKVNKAAADFKRNAPALLKRYLDGTLLF